LHKIAVKKQLEAYLIDIELTKSLSDKSKFLAKNS